MEFGSVDWALSKGWPGRRDGCEPERMSKGDNAGHHPHGGDAVRATSVVTSERRGFALRTRA